MKVSWLRDWVQELSLREQGTLVVATRGCDLAPKIPLDSPERRMTSAIRYAVGTPFDQREVDSQPGCFMSAKVPIDVKLGMLEHYPFHYVVHVIHACEVLGYRHPNNHVAAQWLGLYRSFCHSMHVPPETLEQMVRRLTEDRIAGDNVVTL